MADAQVYLAGAVSNQTIPPLIAQVTDRVSKGARSLLLAISSPGGNIYWGITAYNFLMGLGIEVITHNVGQVDSIAGVLFCAGERRLSVPEGRFLIHGVNATFPGADPVLTEKQIESRLAALTKDRETIAAILSTRTGKALEGVAEDMFNEVILTAPEAKDYGFVTEITTDVFDPSQEIIQIVLP